MELSRASPVGMNSVIVKLHARGAARFAPASSYLPKPTNKSPSEGHTTRFTILTFPRVSIPVFKSTERKIYHMRPVHLIALLSGSAVAWYDCPFPTCEGCLPASVHDAPGIGFGLSFSSGYASLQVKVGSMNSDGHIPAMPWPISTMAQW